MRNLEAPAGLPLEGINPELADQDSMFDGDSERYLAVGMSALGVIERAFLGAADPSSILDIPCGFGRVTRMLRARYPAARISVCDLDRAAVDFASARFDARGFYSCQKFRDLEIRETFDLIWVGSLLTHLPEHQARQFLDFAARHMHRDSRLIITTHGPYVATRLRSWTYGLSELAACALLAEYSLQGYAFRGYAGDQNYGISLSRLEWFEQLLSGSSLMLESYQARGWDRHQDALVLRLAPAEPRRRFWRPSGRPIRSFEQSGSPAIPPVADEQAARDADGRFGFDEGWYLGAYTDVADAVANGIFASGLAHYQAFGWREGRSFCDPARLFEARAISASADGARIRRRSRVEEVWSTDPAADAAEAGWYWMAHPTVRARVNTLASGDARADAYDRLSSVLRERGCEVPIRKSLSLGCGFGSLERDLVGRGIVVEMDAYDLAAGAIAEARRQAAALGMTHLRFHVADLEAIQLAPGSIDVVFAHSSIHHVERLVSLYGMVRRALRPGGIFHLNEFVGPTRFQWTDAQLALSNVFLDGLPERLRRLPSGQPKERLRRPTIEEMIAADPSEAIRSADLVAALDGMFDILEMRPVGGALLHLALGGIAQNFDPDREDDEAALRRLFDLEDAAMSDGRIGSDFAVIIAARRDSA